MTDDFGERFMARAREIALKGDIVERVEALQAAKREHAAEILAGPKKWYTFPDGCERDARQVACNHSGANPVTLRTGSVRPRVEWRWYCEDCHALGPVIPPPVYGKVGPVRPVKP